MLAAVQEFFLFHLCCMQSDRFFLPTSACRNFIFQNHPSPLSKVKWSAPKIYYHLYRNYLSTRNTSVSKLRQNLPGTSRAIKNITKRRKSSTERHHYVHKNSCKKPHFGKQNYLTWRFVCFDIHLQKWPFIIRVTTTFNLKISN